MKKRIIVWMLGLLAVGAFCASAEDITITFTTNVVQEGVIPTGINAAGSTSFGARKLMHTANFEGSTYRQMIDGILYSNRFAWNMGNFTHPKSGIAITGWDQIYTGAFFRVESDPARNVTGTVTHITSETIDLWGNGNMNSNSVVFNFDRTIAPSVGTDGVYGVTMLVERMDLTGEGFLGDNGNNWWVSTNCTIQTADNAPGLFGVSCMKMDGSAATATYRVYAAGTDRIDPTRGDWKMRFWVKSFSGTPTLTIKNRANSQSSNVTLSTSWVQQTVSFTISNSDSVPTGVMIVNDGAVLIDNVEYWMEGDSNPTTYTDDYVNMLKTGKYGILRNLMMGGETVTNQIFPQLGRTRGRYAVHQDIGPYTGAGSSNGKNRAGIHEFLELCEYVGMEPWVNISGTTTDEEVAAFVEYLTGPTNTTWGGVRADLGHPVPWTDSMDRITVEFGNEAWNLTWSYLAAGSNNKNYWADLISAGQAVQSYSSNIAFTVGGQQYSGGSGVTELLTEDATNAAAYAVAAYTVSFYFDEDAAINTNDELVAQYFMSYPMWEVHERFRDSQTNLMAKSGMEWTFYEYNHHVNKGDVASYADPINTYLVGRAHGVCMANYSLLFLKKYGINRQCYFDAGPWNGAGSGIKLWTSVNSFKQGEESYRPDWLAYQAVNQVRKGELVETTHSIDPTITTYGRYDHNSPDNYTDKTYSSVYSYGFKNGTTNGLVLVNYDLNNTQQITVALSEYVLNDAATQWDLVSDHYTNNNEGASNEVTLVETELTDFANGATVELGPCNLTVLQWVNGGPLLEMELDTQSLSVPEGGNAFFQIRLASAPAHTVTVAVTRTSGDTDLSADVSEVVFTTGNWGTYQTVTISAAEDDGDGDAGVAVFQCLSPDTMAQNVTATEVDNDLYILLSSATLNVTEGSTADVQIRLSKQPSSDVTVDTAWLSGESNITVTSGASLDFTTLNWSNEQTVILRAAHDDDLTNTTALIQSTATGFPSETLTVTSVDDDSLSIDREVTTLDVPEGGTADFRIRLSHIPLANVTVTATNTSGDADITVTGGSPLTFTPGNWNVYQSITLSAEHDADWDEDTATITCSSPDASDRSVTATEDEDEFDPLFSLPWSETFENEDGMAGTLGDLDGQNNWETSTYGAATVTNSKASQGTQSCELYEANISHSFVDNRDEIWVQFKAQPVFLDNAKPWDAAAVFWVNASGQVVARSNSTEITISSPILTEGTWLEFLAHVDYTEQTWDLSVNGTNLFTGFGFASAQTGFSTLMVKGERTNSAFIDGISLSLSDPAVPDADGDGLPDWWETLYYGGATNAVASAMASNGVDTVGDAYIAGINPTNASAFFVVTDLQSGIDNLIYWTGVSGRVYSVYWTSNLLSGFQPLESNVAWTAVPYTDTNHGANAQGFYKIEVELE